MPTPVKKPLEKDILLAICQYLEKREYFFWRNNNKPVFDFKRGAFRHQPKYTPKGLPDIIIVHNGKFIALEVKRPSAALRPEQLDMSYKILRNGGYYHTVHGVNEVVDLLYEK